MKNEKYYYYLKGGMPVIIGTEEGIKKLVKEAISLEDSANLEDIMRLEEINDLFAKNKSVMELAQTFYMELVK